MQIIARCFYVFQGDKFGGERSVVRGLDLLHTKQVIEELRKCVTDVNVSYEIVDDSYCPLLSQNPDDYYWKSDIFNAKTYEFNSTKKESLLNKAIHNITQERLRQKAEETRLKREEEDRRQKAYERGTQFLEELGKHARLDIVRFGERVDISLKDKDNSSCQQLIVQIKFGHVYTNGVEMDKVRYNPDRRNNEGFYDFDRDQVVKFLAERIIE